MDIKQISVFLENKTGRLSEVTDCLFQAGINIKALYLADTTDFGVLRMIVNDNGKALTALKARNFVAQVTDVVAVEVEDKPGGLNRILKVLNANAINIEYMYAFVEKRVANAIVIFKIDNQEKAKEVLSANGITLVSEAILKNI